MQMKDIISRFNPNQGNKIGELLRFGVVGLGAALLQYLLYWLFIQVIHHSVAITVSYVISFVFNYYASTKYTFKVRRNTQRGAGFALAHSINYLLQLSTLNAFIMAGVSRELAPLPMFAVCVPVNFLMVRFFLKNDGIRILKIFKLSSEEKPIALIIVGLLLTFHVILVSVYYNAFTPITHNYWKLFINTFQVSGFDPITYHVVSDWGAFYNVYRHPLLVFYMYVPYLLNQALMWLTGINCAIFVVSAIILFCAFYAFILLYRILRRLVGLKMMDAALLSFFLYSFAYVLLAAVVPDHFIMSLFCILLSLYVAGKRMQEGRPMSMTHTIVLFLLIAGTTLSNGLKVFMAALFANGKGFFRPRFFLFACLVPALGLWLFARFEYQQMVLPRHIATQKAIEKKREEARKKREEQEKKMSVALAKTTITPQKHVWKDSTKAVTPQPKKKVNPKQGKPIAEGEFMQWTDISTSRWLSVKENLLGESIQLHQQHLLKDTLRKRPIFVEYDWTLNYVVEMLIVLLFAAGVWAGRRSRLLWMAMGCVSIDLAVHIGLGFGINEVYIMAAHWIFVIPLAIAFALHHWQGLKRMLIRGILILLTLYLWLYNGYLIIYYLLA